MALSEQGGMYSTKVRCNMKATEGIAGGIIPTTKYITIKDPYKDVKDTVPGRWKSKQFAMDNDPKLCKEQKLTGAGYFGYNGFAFKAPEKGTDKYVEQVSRILNVFCLFLSWKASIKIFFSGGVGFPKSWQA